MPDIDTNDLGPMVAGTWYPAEPSKLREMLRDWMGPVGSSRSPRGLVVPHAGFAYSGPTAARGFAGVGPDIERVLLIGPSHYAAFDGAAIPAAARYRTPLCASRLDHETLARLAERPGFRRTDAPFMREHSLEAEIPFLHDRLGDRFELVPILIGAGTTAGTLDRVAVSLDEWVTPGTLIVASSDLTHFGRRFDYVPFEDEIPRRIEQLDRGAIEPILGLDRAGFADYVNRTGITVCGARAIDLLLRLLPASSRGVELGYTTSGRLTGDWAHCVSYACLAFGLPDEGASR